MADIIPEIDLDSVIDRLLEGELASPKQKTFFFSFLFGFLSMTITWLNGLFYCLLFLVGCGAWAFVTIALIGVLVKWPDFVKPWDDLENCISSSLCITFYIPSFIATQFFSHGPMDKSHQLSLSHKVVFLYLASTKPVYFSYQLADFACSS